MNVSISELKIFECFSFSTKEQNVQKKLAKVTSESLRKRELKRMYFLMSNMEHSSKIQSGSHLRTSFVNVFLGVTRRGINAQVSSLQNICKLLQVFCCNFFPM